MCIRDSSISDLLEKIREQGVEVSEELRRSALDLDRHYLQSRYVNTFYSGAPVDYYGLEDAEKALREAEALVGYFKEKIRGS